MKLVRILFPLFIVSLLACHKEAAKNPAWVFSASIDGKPWIASQTFSNIIGGWIMISGSDTSGRAIDLVLKGTAAGEYPLGLKLPSGASYVDSIIDLHIFSTDQSGDTSLAGGKVVVTAINTSQKRITGNFYLNLYNDSVGHKVTVTQGIIDLPYEN